MKHVVIIKSRKPSAFNYCKFGTYKNKKGKLIELVDPNGITTTGYEMFQAVLSLDLNDEDDKRVFDFLKDHPLIMKGFSIEDMSEKENKQAELALAKADSVTAAATLSKKEIENLCRLIGLNGDWDDNIRKAKVISFASDNPTRFLDYLNDADASFKIFIKNCIDADVFSRVNGVYKYGTTTIGLTEDQSIMWLKDNADIMALLKNQLRGNVTEEVVSKKVIKEKVN
tara:strand:- start:29080 stop:29760 length:681 start_codon:yes stop_codon:yes gene_type:complete